MEEIKKEPVTVLLILINTLIFLVVEFTGGSENGQHMLECGAAYAPLILEPGQWYRMFSSMFLHFGAPHLINNMLVLFVLGQRLEPVTGKIKFFLIYIFGGLGGNMLSLFLICMQETLLYLQELPELFLQSWAYDLCDHTAQRKSGGSDCQTDADHGRIFTVFRICK
mgnify:CR=1 FL=1